VKVVEDDPRQGDDDQDEPRQREIDRAASHTHGRADRVHEHERRNDDHGGQHLDVEADPDQRQ
jgi:hypothetical protein